MAEAIGFQNGLLAILGFAIVGIFLACLILDPDDGPTLSKELNAFNDQIINAHNVQMAL